jgi:hypothetical protein
VDELFDEPVATPIGRDPFVPLPVDDVKRLLSMIDKLLERIEIEQQRIVACLRIGDSF